MKNRIIYVFISPVHPQIQIHMFLTGYPTKPSNPYHHLYVCLCVCLTVYFYKEGYIAKH